MKNYKSYKKLKNVNTYNCPSHDPVYKTINNGVNCLCKDWNDSNRDSENKQQLSKWPVGNPDLGWKIK